MIGDFAFLLMATTVLVAVPVGGLLLSSILQSWMSNRDAKLAAFWAAAGALVGAGFTQFGSGETDGKMVINLAALAGLVVLWLFSFRKAAANV